MKSKYWIVLSTDVLKPLPRGLPLWKFTSQKAARDEAQIWAAQSPGISFVVLQAQYELTYPIQPQLVVENLY